MRKGPYSNFRLNNYTCKSKSLIEALLEKKHILFQSKGVKMKYPVSPVHCHPSIKPNTHDICNILYKPLGRLKLTSYISHVPRILVWATVYHKVTDWGLQSFMYCCYCKTFFIDGHSWLLQVLHKAILVSAWEG